VFAKKGYCVLSDKIKMRKYFYFLFFRRQRETSSNAVAGAGNIYFENALKM